MKQLIRLSLGKGADMLFEPMTAGEVVRRTAARLGLSSVPYLVIASTFADFVDDRLIRGFWYCYLVILIPAVGLLADVWRLRRTRLLHPKIRPG
jgi:hypothetical protein